MVSASIEESASNPWARICDLVDLKKPVVSSRPSSSGGAGGGSGSGSVSRKGLSRGMDEDNVFRATEKMRSLIIQVCVRASVCPSVCSSEDAGGKSRSRRRRRPLLFFLIEGGA